MIEIDSLRSRVRTIPDWPQRGVSFRDITPLLQDRRCLRMLVDALAEHCAEHEADLVAAIEARGFIVGAILARELDAGFVPIRKLGKLPFTTIREDYQLEYGSTSVEMHADACAPGSRVLLVDDLIATGGTMIAGSRLIRRLGGDVVGCAAIIDLPALGGSARLRDEHGSEPFTLMHFDA